MPDAPTITRRSARDRGIPLPGRVAAPTRKERRAAKKERRMARRIEAQGGGCHYCGRALRNRRWDCAVLGPEPADQATHDHRTPRCEGGGQGANLCVACRACNADKGHLNEAEYRLVLALRAARS